MNRRLFAAGAVSAFLCVALGAFGAHSLDLPERFAATYHTASEYQMTHSLGILIAAFAGDKLSKRLAGWAGNLFLAGIVFFSGSLYVLSVTEITWLGAITPIGGLCFLAGWILLAAGAIRRG